MADTGTPTHTHTPLSDRLDHMALLKASVARMDAAERSAAVARGAMSARLGSSLPPSIFEKAAATSRRRDADKRARGMQSAEVVPFPTTDPKDALIAALQAEVATLEDLNRATARRLADEKRVCDVYESDARRAHAMFSALVPANLRCREYDDALDVIAGLFPSFGPEDAA